MKTLNWILIAVNYIVAIILYLAGKDCTLNVGTALWMTIMLVGDTILDKLDRTGK